MSDRALLKEVTKKHIRALLLSSPVALTVNELKRDFHDFIGEPLPYQKMGYVTLEDFFRDIEDVVYIGYKGGMMTLQAKADATTKHIEKLVSKQKVSNPKKYAVLRKGPQRHNERPLPPRLSNRMPHHHPRPKPPIPIVPAYVKHQLKQLFDSYPDGLPFTHFEVAFSSRFGSRLNFKKFGFLSVTELLSSVKEIVKLQELQGGEWRVLPAHSHPSRQSQDNATDHNRKMDMQSRPSRGRGRRRMDSGCSEQDVKSEKVAEKVEADVDQFEDDDSGISETLQLELRQLLSESSSGMWASRLSFEYLKKFNKSLDFQDQGHHSVIEFVAALPHIAHIERPDPQGDWLLFDARIPKSEIPKPESRTDQKLDAVQKGMEHEVKEAIQKVLHKHRTGILVQDFPAVYKSYTGCKLPVDELGFDGPEGLVLSLADSVLQLAYRGNAQLMLFPMDCDILQYKEESTPVVEELPPPESSERPSDVVGPGCHYTPLIIPNANEFVEVYVSNVVNPGLFWVQLRKKTASLALELLMDNLELAYREGSEKYKMADSLMLPGQVCATLFPEDNNWHRGVIVGQNDEGFVEIYFVDYGNSNFVDRSTICYLKMEFLKLPAQAIQARLANIKPKGKVWKNAAKNRLLQLCISKPLVAYVTTTRDQVLTVCLTDTTTSVDIHINDLLVTENHAIFCQDDSTTSYSGPADIPEVPDYTYVYGWSNNREAPRMPRLATSSQPSPVQPGQQTEHRQHSYVKWVQLTKDHVIHLINLKGVAYVVSAEVSSFFWDEDILTMMLKQKRVEVPKLLVSSSDFPELFEELRRYDVPSLKEDALGTRLFITLYELKSIPDILKVFEHTGELLKAVEELIPRFDPLSPYWKNPEVEDNESNNDVAMATDCTEETPPESELTYDEQQLTLQALQFKRKRILQLLMNNPCVSSQTVNELNSCEAEIELIKNELTETMVKKSSSVISDKKSRSSPSVSSASVGSMSSKSSLSGKVPLLDEEGNQADCVTGTQHGIGTNQSLENQRVIESIMAASTKPIATANIMTKPTTSVSNYSHLQQSYTTTINQSALDNVLGDQSSYRRQAGNQQGITLTSAGNQHQVNLNMLIQQQRFNNPQFYSQQGIMNPGLAFQQQLQNQAQLRAQQQVQQGMNPGLAVPGLQYSGLLPAVAPLMYTNNQLPMALAQAQLQGMGRGQHQPCQNTMGLLPGLYPLLQNLTLGRGGTNRNSNS